MGTCIIDQSYCVNERQTTELQDS